MDEEFLLTMELASARRNALQVITDLRALHDKTKKDCATEDLSAGVTEARLQAMLSAAVERARSPARRRRGLSDADGEAIIAEAATCLNVQQAERDGKWWTTMADVEVITLGFLCYRSKLSKALGYLSNPGPLSFAADFQKRYGAEAPYDVMLAYFERLDQLAQTRTRKAADGQ